MDKSLTKMLAGYQAFREKYALGDYSIMEQLAVHGQKPETMVVACCDSRVDPSVILQCDPGELFTVRNVANVVPPYESDEKHHGTSAALEFGICHLNVKHLIVLGHSQCGGINALLHSESLETHNDFISNWVSGIQCESPSVDDDTLAKEALITYHKNCLSFPWIKTRVENKQLMIHLWFFTIKEGQIYTYDAKEACFVPL